MTFQNQQYRAWIHHTKPVVSYDEKTITTEDFIQLHKKMARLKE